MIDIPKPQTPEPSTLHPKPKPLNPEIRKPLDPELLNLQPSTRNPNPKELQTLPAPSEALLDVSHDLSFSAVAEGVATPWFVTLHK